MRWIMSDDWPVDDVSVAVVYEDIVSPVLQPLEWGHCADRPPGARHHHPDHPRMIVTSVIITFSRLLSLFRVVSWRQLSLILLLLTITSSGQQYQADDISVYYVSFIGHIGMRGALLTPLASPEHHHRPTWGNRSQQISFGPSYVREREPTTDLMS